MPILFMLLMTAALMLGLPSAPAAHAATNTVDSAWCSNNGGVWYSGDSLCLFVGGVFTSDNFAGSNLQSANMSFGDFSYANFTGANTVKANITGAIFTGATDHP